MPLQTEAVTQNPWAIGQIARLTRNLEKSADWFRDTIGLRETIRSNDMVFFQCDELRLYLSQGDPEKNSILYFRVNEIHREVERLRAALVEIRSAPHCIHVHENGDEEWMAFFLDPDGCPLGLMSVASAKKKEQT